MTADSIKRATYFRLTEAVYRRWCPEKLDKVGQLMGKYNGQEDEVYHKALEVYVFKKGPKVWQPLIEAMYRRFNPAKLETLKDILQKYEGDEAGLFKALCDKYVPTLRDEDAPLELCDWMAAESEDEDGSAKSAVDSSSASPCSSRASNGRIASPSPDSSSVEEAAAPAASAAGTEAQSNGQQRNVAVQGITQQQQQQQQQPRQQKHSLPQPQHQAPIQATPDSAASHGRPDAAAAEPCLSAVTTPESSARDTNRSRAYMADENGRKEVFDSEAHRRSPKRVNLRTSDHAASERHTSRRKRERLQWAPRSAQTPRRTTSRADMPEPLSDQRRDGRRASRPHIERSSSPADRRNGGISRPHMEQSSSPADWHNGGTSRHSRGEHKTAILRPACEGAQEREHASRRQPVVLVARSRARTTDTEDRARATRNTAKQQQQQQQQHQQQSRSRSRRAGGVVYKKAQAREQEVMVSRRHREVVNGNRVGHGTNSTRRRRRPADEDEKDAWANDRHPPPWHNKKVERRVAGPDIRRHEGTLHEEAWKPRAKRKQAARERTWTPSARRRWHSPRSPSAASAPRAAALSNAGSQSRLLLADSETVALSSAAASALPTRSASSEEDVPQSCSSAAQRPSAPSSPVAQRRRATLPTPLPPTLPAAQSSSGSGGRALPSIDAGGGAAAAADSAPSSSGNSAHIGGMAIASTGGAASCSSAIAAPPSVERSDNGCVAAHGGDELVGFEALQAFVKAAPQVDRTQKRRPKSLKARVEYNGQQVEFELSNKSTLAEVAVMFSRWLSVQCGMPPASTAVPVDIGAPPGNLAPTAAAVAS